jgi:hypothetical protein
MPTITIISDGDPYPAKAGRTSLTNDGSTQRAGFGGNNTISDQNYNFVFEYRAGTNTSSPQDTALGPMGVANNGAVLFSPSAAPGRLPGGNQIPNAGWTFNAVFNEASYGVDACGGHPESNGEYHYHSGAFLTNCWDSKLSSGTPYYNDTDFGGDKFRHTDGHSKVLGWCFDGYPLYGPYGYQTPDDPQSTPVQMTSSWSTLSAEGNNRGFTYSQIPAGSFVQDHEYVTNAGTLDEYNGRFCITPDYPGGTYAYFLTFASGDFNTPVFPYIFGLRTKEQRDVTGA